MCNLKFYNGAYIVHDVGHRGVVAMWYCVECTFNWAVGNPSPLVIYPVENNKC